MTAPSQIFCKYGSVPRKFNPLFKTPIKIAPSSVCSFNCGRDTARVGRANNNRVNFLHQKIVNLRLLFQQILIARLNRQFKIIFRRRVLQTGFEFAVKIVFARQQSYADFLRGFIRRSGVACLCVCVSALITGKGEKRKCKKKSMFFSFNFLLVTG